MTNRLRPPRLGRRTDVRLPTVRRIRLATGLEVLHVPRHTLPLVDLHLVVPAGVELDTPERAGLVTLVAEMLEEGTVTRSGFEIADQLDRLGATLSVRPGWDQTTIALHVLRDRLPEALALMADVVGNATFAEAEFRKRRDERLAALLQERDEPSSLAARAFIDAVYGVAHPYGQPARGTRATVSALDRDALIAFHAARYRPAGSYMVGVGDVTAEALEEQAALAFGGWTGEARRAEPPAAPSPAPGIRIVLVDRPDAPQSELRIGRAGPPRRSPDHAALLVANTVLGGAFTSRLNLRLREQRGFTYGARSSFAFRRGPGPFAVATAVFTDVTAEAVADAIAEMRRMTVELVPEDELERARSFWVLGLPRRLETASAMAAQLAELHLHDLPPTAITDLVEQVGAVTAEDVLRVTRAYLAPDAMAVVVVGDADRIRGPLQALGLGPVVDHTVEI